MAQFSYSSQAAESTFIYEATPTTNFGTNVELSVGRSAAGQIRRSLLRFPNLPAGVTTIANGKLYLYSSAVSMTAPRDLTVYRVLRNWVETQATWNVYSTGNNWGTAGCANATDFESTTIGTVSVPASPAANSEIIVPLTSSLLLAYLAAQSTYAGAFLLKMVAAEATNDYWRPHSNDAVTPTLRPKLTFDYWLGKGVRNTFVGA